MFEEFFGLRTKPFGKTPDPALLYESDQMRKCRMQNAECKIRSSANFAFCILHSALD